MLSYDKKELKNKSTYEVSHPDDIANDIKHREQLINSDQKYLSYQKRYLHKKGYYIWCIVTISVVRKNDKPLFFIVQLQDITESKRSNQLLENQKEELENIKLDLESRIIQLQESNYIIAHNLKSPISNIQMLIDSINNESNEQLIDQFWELLERSNLELQETLNDLNSVLNIKYNSDIILEKCDFEEVLNDLIQYNKQEIIARDISIEADFQVKNIYYSRIYLENIIDALIRNAVTFIELNKKPVVKIKTYLQDGETVLEIKDNGMGIDLEKYKSQIFMFQKIIHRGFKGKGLGLFMVKYRIESFGGKVDVESTVGEGSTFYIKFSDKTKTI